MNGRLAAAGAAIALLLGSAIVGAKGRTVRITIASPHAPAVQVTDPAVSQFNVWSGVGVTVGGVSQLQGFIVDWSHTVAAPPAGLVRHEVTFHAARENQAEHAAYVVTYVYDPAVGNGYVYLPRPDEPHGQLNTASIRRGVEGHWFRATAAWEAFVRPLLTTNAASGLQARLGIPRAPAGACACVAQRGSRPSITWVSFDIP